MRKHAYLIEAHNNRKQLELLLRCLDYKYNDIFIHIDSRSCGFENFAESNLLNYSALHVVSPIRVRWGGYSQIAVELLLLESALKQGDYCRFHLVSGVDLPLSKQEEIHTFFNNRPKTEFVHYDFVNSPEIYRKRMAQYHMLRDHIDRRHRFLSFIEKLSVELQHLVGINRLKKSDIEMQKGANWFSITDRCANYIVGQKEWIENHFRYTKCCDEVFLQTLVYNSEFKNHRYYDEEEGRFGNLRFTDWKRGNPYVFRNEDFDELMNSRCFFARKFDEQVDYEIIERIVHHVMVDSEPI